MPEQELNPSASKFIASLVKSLQIICNGHVDFNESIELIGHINVRIDHKFKYNYVLDEHVRKEGEDCSTIFLSNSYHSNPPSRQNLMKHSDMLKEQDLSLMGLPSGFHGSQQSKSTDEDSTLKNDDDGHKYGVSVESPKEPKNQMVFKLEGGDDSNGCMLLPTIAGDYEPADEASGTEVFSSDPRGSPEDGMRIRKRQRITEQGPKVEDDSKVPAVKRRTMRNRKKAKFPRPTVVQTKPRKFANPEETRRLDQLWSKSEDTYLCSMCPYNTTYRNRVRAHCRSVHMGIPRKYKGNEKGYFVCDKCGKEFTSNRGFRMHTLSKHLNQYPYRCQECSKGFMSVSAHRDHMNMHAGVALQCMGCETLFYTEYGLKRHLLRKHPELL